MTQGQFPPLDAFAPRHIGPRGEDVTAMLKEVGAASLDALIDEAIPASIRLEAPLNLPEPESESTYLTRLKTIASRNKVFRSFIGLGYFDTLTPSVIRRCVFENPGWYTPYTPYQAEIAQGRLESLLNFQTMVVELTGMAVANASLLDEGTAAGEAMVTTQLAVEQTELIRGARLKPLAVLSDQPLVLDGVDPIPPRRGCGQAQTARAPLRPRSTTHGAICTSETFPRSFGS